MNQWELSKSYENICPIHRPVCQTESGRNYNEAYTTYTSEVLNTPTDNPMLASTQQMYNRSDYRDQVKFQNKFGVPTRFGIGMYNYMQSDQGMTGGFNNSIVRLGEAKFDANKNQIGWENMYVETVDGEQYLVVKVKWREPLFVSPFSSRYDATFGRPLYNITSMDFSFNLQNLGNMIRVANLHHPPDSSNRWVADYSVNIDSALLCYQVMTIPPIISKPLTTLVPYRRFVPYITEVNQTGTMGQTTNMAISKDGAKDIEILSGVYTLNEIPTAIWIFCAPTKNIYQTNKPDIYIDPDIDDDVNCMTAGNWESNNLFGYLRHVNISLANTTQILNTAEPYDLYRIAKANGCQDSFLSWGVDDALLPKTYAPALVENGPSIPTKMYYGAGSVLRLKPGVDIIVPDVPLIPGANANNMVFQCRAKFNIPPHSETKNTYALWLLFEYVGVAAISPGQCEITMNPLGTGEIMAVSPVMSATSEATEGSVEGSGFWEKANKATKIAQQIADSGAISKILACVPGGKDAAAWAQKHGFGEPAGKKRNRGGAVCGGAVLGRGLNDWI